MGWTFNQAMAYVVLELSSLGTDQPGDTDFEEWIVPSQ
jgi:hypothetical protein